MSPVIHVDHQIQFFRKTLGYSSCSVKLVDPDVQWLASNQVSRYEFNKFIVGAFNIEFSMFFFQAVTSKRAAIRAKTA